MEASLDLSYSVLYQNSGIYKNTGTSLWNFVVNSGLRIFRHSELIDETRHQVSSTKVGAQKRDNLDCRQSAKLTIPPKL